METQGDVTLTSEVNLTCKGAVNTMDSGVDWKSIAIAACSLVSVLSTYVMASLRSEMHRQAKTLTTQAEKLAMIDKSCITRDELHRELKLVGERIESRHQENRETLEGISRKMDINEEKDAKTRHDIRDAVNTLVINTTVLQRQWDVFLKDKGGRGHGV